MATFVLVHGSCHGGWCWKKVTPLLSIDGHEVYTPTLTGLGERSHWYQEMSDWILTCLLSNMTGSLVCMSVEVTISLGLSGFLKSVKSTSF